MIGPELRFAALQLCSFAALQLCSFAALQLCSFAALQLCSFGPHLHLYIIFLADFCNCFKSAKNHKQFTRNSMCVYI
jgi:hypothetical protein